ncbi:MAG: plasmid pRiA4b ORF-3 family protein [Thermoguttaceae bacterium]
MSETLYQLKITLLECKPAIWRKFVVPSNVTLNKLHYIIQSVMGWQNCHMHSFIAGKEYYGISDEDLPEDEYTLNDIASKKGDKFKYWYDFGDDWMHQIVVENVNYTNPDCPHPICCIAGAGACPPEDCGGIYGFVDFCDAISNPKHPEHKELKSWYGGKYDPLKFDIDAINKKFGVKHSASTASAAKKNTQKAAKKAAPQAGETPVKKAVKKTVKKAAKKTTSRKDIGQK